MTDFPWRPLHETDTTAFVALIDATCDADDVDKRADASVLPFLLAHPLGTPDLGFFRGAFDGDVMIAAGAVWPEADADPVHWMHADGGVHPGYRGRGVGAGMFRWMLEIAPQIHHRHFPDRPLELCVTTTAENSGARELFVAEGFAPVRWSFTMSRPADAPFTTTPVPAGLDLAPYRDEFKEPLRLAHNEAFLDHWHEPPFSPESWDAYITRDSVSPELTFLMSDRATGEIAGYLVSAYNHVNFEATGVKDIHFELIGTRRAYRKRGVASALIAHATNESRALGYETASLGVDAENPSGALGLYEKHGFACVREWVHYCKQL